MYEERIKALAQPSFLRIRQIAANELSGYTEEERNRFYDRLSRGTALLDSHELMCQYLYSYGNMHKSKIDEALSHMPNQLFDDKTIQIIDWGCGQGLATICFFDYIRENNITCTISKAVLIEPASMTLDRAKLHVSKYLDSNRISALPKYFNELENCDIESSADITLHFFSNILDVEAVDIKDLAKRISNIIQGEHYFVCIGPLNSNNRRIDSFYDWFITPELIWEDQHNKDNHNYTAKYKLFKIERFSNQPVIVPYNPPVQFHAAMVLDGVRNALQDNAEKASAILKHLSAFEVATPFDIGASIYEDVDPLFAVLNNIIVRGLPTKASPFIEKAFCSLGNKESESNLGGIDFELPVLSGEEAFLALHTLDNRFLFGKETYNTSILDSNFEQDFITNPSNHFLSHFLQPQRYLKSITNQGNHYAQRVDFALEFPYSSLSENKGIVIELDGARYHQGEQVRADEQRDKELQNCKWSCIRIKENSSANDYLKDVKSNYFNLAQKAFNKPYTKEWIRTLQLVFSPIAIARIEKTIIEALLTQKLDIKQTEWNIFVDEKDVPCAVLAFADLQQMFLHISELSEDYADYKLPQINLTVISNKEFVSSPLHKLNESNGINIKVYENTTEAIKAKTYDLVIDIAVMRRSGIEKIDFSDYKCKNECYFNIRSSHYSRTDRYIYTSDVINYKPLVIKDSQGLYLPIAEQERHLQYFLQMLFRKQAFRPGQLPILSRALQNKSVIGLLPTGGGKSLTYQIAAMLQPGVTIVVDPLRSLMKDQYDGLLKAGIDTCTFINSTISAQEKEECAKMMEYSRMQFVFLSPERLCIYNFRERLKNMHELGVYFAYGVIDEVHCVSEWGHDFRFTYLHLGRNLYNYVLPKQTESRKHLTLFGLTATASFDVLADVERELSGNGQFPLDSDCIVRDDNTNRLELQYKIERVPIEYENDKYFDQRGYLDRDLPKAVNISDKWATYSSKHSFLEGYIEQIPGYFSQLQTEESFEKIINNFYTRQNKASESEHELFVSMPSDFAVKKEEYEHAGIVFCPHKKSTGISVIENANTLSKAMEVGTFMGSSDDDEHSDEIDKESFKNLELFRNNKLPLMIATKAFGMGIDKPNVRFTINMNYSSSLESFVQEAGRAGRDRNTALSVILLSDYHLVRISPKYSNGQFPLGIIKNKWFKENDLKLILNRYHLAIPNEYIDHFTPDKDMVKLRCEVCNTRFAFGKCEESCDKCPKGPCQYKCEVYDQCQLRKVPKEAKGYQYIEDLKEILSNHELPIPAKNLEYLNTDYETVMYFYNNNFKGSLIEKKTMHDLLSRSSTSFFKGNDAEHKKTYEVSNFLNDFFNSPIGTELVAYISLKTIVKYKNNLAYLIQIDKKRESATIQYITTSTQETINTKGLEIYRDKSDIAKAIYRMCCIGMIDDFTEDYALRAYRIVAIRKADGEYYKELQKYLERYYSKTKAEEEIQKVPNYEGENEIHKCLGYLTEFIYEKIAVKRKRAIDDIRSFCMLGIQKSDWKETNEELKDFIYYYFNSKYARRDFEYPDLAGNNQFSLTTETDNGKTSDFNIVLKYMTVVDDHITSQDSSSQIDNVKHLQGAVRLIRRSLTDSNPAIDFLNVFCLLYLGINDNETLINETKESYLTGYNGFYESYQDKDEFYNIIETFKQNLTERNIQKEWISKMKKWELEAEIEINTLWINEFKQKYLSK